MHSSTWGSIIPKLSNEIKLNLFTMNMNEYDAIVVGTGISGGWAAKELTENGLTTLA